MKNKRIHKMQTSERLSVRLFCQSKNIMKIRQNEEKKKSDKYHLEKWIKLDSGAKFD